MSSSGDHTGFPDLTATSSQKRKRNAESSSPESRRKRGAAAATAVAANALAVSDAEAQSFLESTVGLAQAAHDQVNVDDFQALQQATVDHSGMPDNATASSTAAAALTIYPTLTIPQSTEETFAAHAAAEGHHDDQVYNPGSALSPADGLPTPQMQSHSGTPMVPSSSVPPEANYRAHNPKPTVGSEEWHKMRKDNHKEVERRRRETINEGINELSKIVPNCERNKGQILQRAVSFIQQLKENEHQNIEKWTLEKLLTEQAIAELSQSNDKLKSECERLYRELETWKKVAHSAGLQPEKEETSPSS
ncbi:hypothetical protein QBC39DRAFT_388885 [Podospora conica]|nr:hypothetical protein QBC39DRAFT_388885 [Schizothecium conicum]